MKETGFIGQFISVLIYKIQLDLEGERCATERECMPSYLLFHPLGRNAG